MFWQSIPFVLETATRNLSSNQYEIWWGIKEYIIKQERMHICFFISQIVNYYLISQSPAVVSLFNQLQGCILIYKRYKLNKNTRIGASKTSQIQIFRT